jgi:hypothetical protein
MLSAENGSAWWWIHMGACVSPDCRGGRYLQPEPLLQSPYYSLLMAMEGQSTPTYAYALNNPVHYTDPTGLCPPGSSCAASAFVLPSGEVISMADAVAMGLVAAGAGAALGTEMSGTHDPQGLIEHMDKHIAKVDACANSPGDPDDPNDPNKRDVHKWKEEIKTAITNIEKMMKRMPKNKAKREAAENAMKRGQDALNRWGTGP